MMFVPLVRSRAFVAVGVVGINSGRDNGNRKVRLLRDRVNHHADLRYLALIRNVPHLRTLGAFALGKVRLRAVHAARGHEYKRNDQVPLH